MPLVRIPPLVSGAAPNLKFSRSPAFGTAPHQVSVGPPWERYLVVFERPEDLVARGVQCDPRIAELLAAEAPGFKLAAKLGSRVKPCPKQKKPGG
jgi:hypothetical protein